MNKYKSLKHNLIGDKRFYSRVVAILVPIVIQNTVTNVVSLVDNVMVGAVGTLQMSAVAIVNQLLFVFYLCIFGGLAGAGIFATQYAGAKDDEGIRYCFRIKIYTAFFMLAAALFIFGFLPDRLISMYLSEGTRMAAQIGEGIIDGIQLLLQHAAYLSGGIGSGIGGIRFDQIDDRFCLGQIQFSV